MKWSAIALGALTLLGIQPAFAQVETRITAVNGNYGSTTQTLSVNPGDVISLSADQVETNGRGEAQPLGKFVEDFQWNSDVSQNDFCDPQYECTGTNFETNTYGVSFYVPYNMGQSIRVSVQNKTDGTYDEIELLNGRAADAPIEQPGDIISDPDDYANPVFDADQALAGQGRWVYIDGERVFVPYAYQDDWVPYRNGYWYYTDTGWTWMSYDSWGWVTDHYGYWRHHQAYGWIWIPYNDWVWRPHSVTFFYTDGGIGWYPYASGYAQGYRRGFQYGYNDGYWDGFRAGLNTSYFWGGTYVDNRWFVGGNIYGRHYRVISDVRVHYNRAYSSRWYGGYLRDHRHGESRRWVEGRCGRVEQVPMRRITRNHRGGRVEIVTPARRVTVPGEYQRVRETYSYRHRAGRRTPVGAIVRPGDNSTPGGRIERPRDRNRVVTPRRPDGREVKPPSRGSNEGRRPRQPSQPTRPVPQPRPRPERPNPRPERPAPRPTAAPTPRPERPVPRPTPAPAPAPRPERPAPRPTAAPTPRPAPERPRPTPAPAPRPAPERPRPTPAPAPAPRPERPAPAPRPERPRQPDVRPSPRPERPAPTPGRPSNPSNPNRGGGRHPRAQ